MATKNEELVHILVIGKTRVGKSAIINAIAGEKVAREGQSTIDITRKVGRYDFTIGDVKYVVWEAPGLQDVIEDDSVVITNLKSALQGECNRLDLVIYCTLMNRERFEQSEEIAIRHITEAFTPNIWKNAVFALTFANRVLPPAGNDADEEDVKWFENRILEFKAVTEEALMKSGVSSDVASEVAVIPAGYHTVSERMRDAREFYGRADWIPQFSQECKNRSRYSSGKESNADNVRKSEHEEAVNTTAIEFREKPLETIERNESDSCSNESSNEGEITHKESHSDISQQVITQHQEIIAKSNDEPVHILVIGKTRVGKSAVINAIAGKKVAREGQSTIDITREVGRYDFTVGDVKYVVWEAPGLQDVIEDDSVVITNLKSALQGECNRLDLVIYCTLMNRERFEQSEEMAIHHITEAFTPNIWKNAVFALTQANRVLPPAGCETDEMESRWFQSRIDNFKNVIVRALAKSGVSLDKASEIAVFPVGYHTVSRRVPNAKQFYGISDWVPQFWKHCEQIVKGSQHNSKSKHGEVERKIPSDSVPGVHIPGSMMVAVTSEQTSNKPQGAVYSQGEIQQQLNEKENSKKRCCCTIL